MGVLAAAAAGGGGAAVFLRLTLPAAGLRSGSAGDGSPGVDSVGGLAAEVGFAGVALAGFAGVVLAAEVGFAGVVLAAVCAGI